MCVSLQESPMHKALFWVAVAVLQLDEVNLYSAGTALLEQNLHTLDTMRVFNDKVKHTYKTHTQLTHSHSLMFCELNAYTVLIIQTLIGVWTAHTSCTER